MTGFQLIINKSSVLGLIIALWGYSCQNVKTGEEPMALLWDGLKAGPYQVGFRVIHTYDTTRTFEYQPDSTLPAEVRPRPMQISMWYPSGSSSEDRMKFRDYIQFLSTEEDFSQITENDIAAAVEHFKAFPDHLGVAKNSDEKMDEFLRTETYSRLHQRPVEDGSFPLILYFPGGDPGGSAGSSFENTVLFEHLASHGYVIASVPSYTGRKISDKGWLPVEKQAIDSEFVLNHMRQYAWVDVKKVATIGYSWGGLGQVVMSLRNDIRAFLSLDAGVSFNHFWPHVQGYSHVKPRNLTMPSMFMLSAPLWKDEWPVGNGDSLTFNDRFFKCIPSDKYLVRFNRIAHRDFVSDQLMTLVLASADSSRIERMPEKPLVEHQVEKEGYRTICELSLHFLNAYLKDNLTSRLFLAEPGLPHDIARIQYYPSSNNASMAPTWTPSYFPGWND